ncbi:hypothetical protein [Pseudoalteromonas spongiae]|uniref:hypothetical protein n=1 Tax=Pseudoalteromonas spongiae TaxID=298657 RepID=UPI001E5E8240|nr:hypothetical protein [Pseudoalteromonas spongiae]
MILVLPFYILARHHFMLPARASLIFSILYQPGELESAVEYIKQFGFVDQHSNKPFPATRPRKDIGVKYNGEVF